MDHIAIMKRSWGFTGKILSGKKSIESRWLMVKCAPWDKVKAGDTGSPEVQVALLTKRIDKLVGHLKGNPSDNHSRRGLLAMVSKRRRLMDYLGKTDPKRYAQVVKRLDLKSK